MLENFSLNEIKERILEIQNLDLLKLSIDEIKSKLNFLFIGFRINTVMFMPGQSFFRGIKYNTKPTFFSQLIYPPSNLTPLGRANRRCVSMFYCATDKEVPFYELNTAPGERLVITHWLVRKPLLVNNVGYTQKIFADLDSNRGLPTFTTLKKFTEDHDEKKII